MSEIKGMIHEDELKHMGMGDKENDTLPEAGEK